MRTNYLYIMSLLVMLGCEKATDWELNTHSADLLVVEAQITNELRSHTIRLSRPFNDLNADPEPVSGAVVAVVVENRPFFFVELAQGTGLYFSDSLQAVVDKTYRLYINLDGKEYGATSQMVPVTPLKPLSYDLVDRESNLYEINFQDSDRPSKKEYWISWGHLPGYQDMTLTETIARTFHYTLESIDVNQLFKPDRASIRFPVGTFVLRRKYSMSDEQQAFYRTFLAETQWRGSPFDVEKGNVATNLSEGAIGYFAVSTVVVDTTLILP